MATYCGHSNALAKNALKEQDEKSQGQLKYGACKSLLVFHCDYVTMSVSRTLGQFLRYSALNNGVTLKSGLEVGQGHCKRRHSTDHILLTISLPL